MKRAIIMLTFLIYGSTSYAFKWPLVRVGYPNDRNVPQHIAATFGEFRPASGGGYFSVKHFHEAVDMQHNIVGIHDVDVCGVEPFTEEVEAKRCDSLHYGGEWHYYMNVKTSWHDFRHVRPRTGLYVGDPVDTTTILGRVHHSYTHLHFTSREYYTGDNWHDPATANNPLDPWTDPAWRFDSLYYFYNTDTMPPGSHPGIIFDRFSTDGQLDTLNETCLSGCVDIIVKAYESTYSPWGFWGQAMR